MRLMVSVVAAVLVTLILFTFMLSMVSRTGRQLDKPASATGIGLVQVNQIALTSASASKRQSLPPPPASAVPVRAAPALKFDVSEMPVLKPSVTAMPELPRVKPGGKPYLGSYHKPVTKKSLSLPPSEGLAKPRATDKRSVPSPVAAKNPTPVEPTKSTLSQAQAVQQQQKSTLSSVAATKMTLNQLPSDSSMGGVAGGAGSSINTPGMTGGMPGNLNSMTGDEVIALLKITPKYPRKAVRSGKEGWVKIEFTITEQGAVVDPKVIASKPRRIFDRAALKAIRKWRFRPKIIDGKAIPRRAVQVIEFSLATG